MALQDIKQISIREYFGGLGIMPQRENKQQGMYCSPLRKENHPSFKVDYHLNLWRDFGSGEGGSIIDLVMKMENISFHEAASKLEKRYASAGASIEMDTFSFHRDNIKDSIPSSGNESSLFVLKVLPITHPALIDFVRERKIDLELANRYCKEIHYRINGRNYFLIGFRNDRSVCELSSPSGFKGCISPKEITTVRNNRDTCLFSLWGIIPNPPKYSRMLICFISCSAIILDFLLFCCEMKIFTCKIKSYSVNNLTTKRILVAGFHYKSFAVVLLLCDCCDSVFTVYHCFNC
ncbi:DNA primase [termite gut metagenome]|uniref:DNA primase n=1 Tax=termite gut metagenome TaxID=433724 RepID=A0A5J4RWK9_9ZZZZ